MNCWDAKPNMGMPISNQAGALGHCIARQKAQRLIREAAQANKRNTSVGQPDLPVDDIVCAAVKTVESGIKSLDHQGNLRATIRYGSDKGSVRRGSHMYDVRTGPAKDLHYTDEIIEQELLSTGDGFTTHFTGNLSWLPVRSTTIRITDGPNTVVDDGNGHLVGNVNAGGTNTINPNTGAYDVTFSSAPASGARIVVDYEYNFNVLPGTVMCRC